MDIDLLESVLVSEIRTIGLMIDLFSDHHRGIRGGIIEYARAQRGWRFYRHGPMPILRKSGLRRWRGDGIIGLLHTPEDIKMVRKLGVPVVNVVSAWEETMLPSVVPDDEAIGRMAAEHLLTQDLGRFAFVGDTRLAHDHRRFKGFKETIAASGKTCRQVKFPFRHGNEGYIFSGTENVKQLTGLIAALPTPIGLFCPHDDHACWVMEACERAALELPRQVCLLGTNNHELVCEHCHPTLSSVAQSSRQIGYHAAALLDRLMDGEPPSPTMRIPPQRVVMRESTDRFVSEDEDVAAALRFIRNNAAKPIVVDDILNVLPISRRLLEMKFKRITGKAPAAEIRHAHIERAKRLLKETDWSISRISMSSGYDSLHGFLLAFKRETKRTPGQFRTASR